MPPRRKALEAAHAQILLHSQAHEAAQAQMLLHSQAHAAAQAQIVALQARVNALELKLEQRGSDATASDMRAATTTTTPLFASRTMHSVVLVLLGLLPLASCGTVCGHGYITRAARAVATRCVAAGFHRVEIRARTDNARSRAVAERLGFQLEGVMRAAEWIGETPFDHAVFARIATS